MSSLTWLLIVFSRPSSAAVWPRLNTYLPARSCAVHLTAAPRPRDELLALLDLSHPLVARYLTLRTDEDDRENQAFHVDVRLLVLIDGDQPDLDLRHHDASASAFDLWQERLRHWSWQSAARRREIAEIFVRSLGDLAWSHDVTIPGSTIYLKMFDFAHAFHGNRNFFWNLLKGRHWDVDDRARVAGRLHQTIERLRRRLATDPALQRELTEALSSRWGRRSLPAVTKRMRRFVAGYRAFLDRQPDPEAKTKALARELGRRRRY